MQLSTAIWLTILPRLDEKTLSGCGSSYFSRDQRKNRLVGYTSCCTGCSRHPTSAISTDPALSAAIPLFLLRNSHSTFERHGDSFQCPSGKAHCHVWHRRGMGSKSSGWSSVSNQRVSKGHPRCASSSGERMDYNQHSSTKSIPRFLRKISENLDFSKNEHNANASYPRWQLLSARTGRCSYTTTF